MKVSNLLCPKDDDDSMMTILIGMRSSVASLYSHVETIYEGGKGEVATGGGGPLSRAELFRLSSNCFLRL